MSKSRSADLAGFDRGGGVDPRHLDLPAVAAALRGGRAPPAWMDQWLASAYGAPAAFVEAFVSFWGARTGGALKFPARDRFDLYHDVVIANLGRSRTALVAGAEGDVVTLSFDALHARCDALSAAWSSEGVAAGEHVCLILKDPIDLAVALLSALRLGLVVSLVSPEGPRHVQSWLARLAPGKVVAGEREQRLVGDLVSSFLSPKATGRGELGSHAYGPADPVLRAISVFGAASVVDVPAARLHLALLRDGALVFGLEPEDRLAAPGFDEASWQPTLLLATLAAGAAFVSVEERDLRADLRVLEARRVTVLGVTRRLRDALLPRLEEAWKPAARAWFRALSDVLDTERWEAFAMPLASRRIPGFVVFSSAASGGVKLFGPRGGDVVAPRVWPVPGEPWQLSEIAGGTLPAFGSTGAFTSLVGPTDEDADLAVPRLVLARGLPGGYLYAGSVDGGREVQVYPAAQVARVAERAAGVRHAAIVELPGQWLNEVTVVLVVFTDGAVGDVSVAGLRALLERELAARYVPDRVEVYPVRPRLEEGGWVDRAWVRSQYLSGALRKKSRSELFRTLSELAYIFGGRAEP